MPYEQVVDGEVVQAATMNLALNQGVLQFATAAARASSNLVPVEGQVSTLDDVDTVERWDGTAWRVVAREPKFYTFTRNSDGTVAANVVANIAGGTATGATGRTCLLIAETRYNVSGTSNITPYGIYNAEAEIKGIALIGKTSGQDWWMTLTAVRTLTSDAVTSRMVAQTANLTVRPGSHLTVIVF